MRPTSTQVPPDRFDWLRNTIVDRHFPYRGMSLEGAVIDFALSNGLEVADSAVTGDDRNMVEVRCRGKITSSTLSDRWTTHLPRSHSYHTVQEENGSLVLRFVSSGG